MTDRDSGRKIYIFGAGGHAKVVADIICRANQFVPAGFVVPNAEEEGLDLFGSPLIGEPSFFRNLENSTANIVIAIGENFRRKEVHQKLSEYSFSFPNIIDPSSIISKGASLGEGNVVMPGCVVNSGAAIGNFSILNTSAIVEHDCVISDFSFLAPNATVCGKCRIGEGSFVGAGATAIHGTKIGDWSVLGAGSVALKNIPDFTVAVGAPAKPIGQKKISDEIL